MDDASQASGQRADPPELAYYTSQLALVTNYRVVFAEQSFETWRIRRSRIRTEGPFSHELHVDVDGLEMHALTTPVRAWLVPIEEAMLRARTNQTHYGTPYVPPPPPPPAPPVPSPPLPQSEWGTPTWNPAWMAPWGGQTPYRVPRPRQWPRLAVVSALVATTLMTCAFVGSSAVHDGGIGVLIGAGARSLYYMLGPLYVLHLIWVYYAWSALPPECRGTSDGDWVPMPQFLIKFFFPLAPYRAFIAHVGVAESTNAVLAAYGSTRRASTKLAWWACTLALLPGPNVIASFLLVAHMYSCDDAQAEMLDRLSKGPPPTPLGPPAAPTPIRWASLVFWLVIGAQVAALIVFMRLLTH
jgi:hypothetical protein